MHRLTDPMLKAFNEQMHEEHFASFLYLAMSAWFAEQHLEGFASHFRARSDEERQHALKIYEHVLQRGGTPGFAALKPPPIKWKSPLAAVEAAYALETKVTASIHELMGLSKEVRDYGSEVFLQWFVAEQIKEETEMDLLVGRLRMTNNNPGALLFLDVQMNQKQAPAPGGDGV